MHRFLVLFLICLSLFAPSYANQIADYVNKSDLNSASIYVLDKNTNNILYKLNEDKLNNTASLLKPIAFKVAYDVLGSDYQFETSLYLDNQKNAYIKLGADVLLTQDKLNKLISNLSDIEFNNLYIDDSIFSKDEYPATWLDEDKWPRQRAISPYIIDNNYTQIAIVRSSLAKKVDIIQNGEYKMPIINELKVDDVHKFSLYQPYGINSPIISLQGTVEHDDIMNIPVLKPEINFVVKLSQALEKNKINYLQDILVKEVPQNSIKIASVSSPIKSISKRIMHNSDNFASEVVLRVAASKYYNKKEATLNDVALMLKERYCDVLSSDEQILDASGVSRRNLLKVETIAKIYIDLMNDAEYLKLFQTSNQGTMADRLLFLQNNIKLKTGTMRHLSGFGGVVKTRNGNDIVLVSIIQDDKKRSALLKNFENALISIIYKYY